ncbi:MAG: hypothetical protein WBM13_10670 [Bacteroidia bacterium]
MLLEKKIKLLGWVSVTVGTLAALISIYPSPVSLIIALPLGFIGMLCSSIYVYIDTTHDINSKKITPGIVGIALSSIPVLIILIFIIYNFLNH